ncbi:hypothetical protein H7849_03945 [Alloacidobacterium dinghuense]|uniref:Histidine kinase n=1 Tax=Alloacidobacterium dinghuense TaxID=2763107 RepID=A0A7G8BKR8_9BACT|nr:sensor histidine kinase [Alloacidobacterium dinghuense]QNI33138.1 hypothetical protein H7849_03945 [Alloacidobacterium dinghuense]
MKSSSTYRDVRLGKHRLFGWAIATLLVLCAGTPAHALDPHRTISQYSHDEWGEKRDFPGGKISAIAQTRDGYLWIGTDKGLIRFDGLNFRVFQQATPESFPIGSVQGLVTDAAGDLWVLLQSTRVLRLHDGKFELGRDQAEYGITAIGKKQNGSVLLSSLTYGPLSYDGRFEIVRSPTPKQAPLATNTIPPGDELSSRFSWATSLATHHVTQPNSAVISIAENADGQIWLGTQDKGLFTMRGGQVSAVGSERLSPKITCLLPLENGELWIGTEKGVFQSNGANLTQTGVPSSIRHSTVFAMIRDRDANIWLGTSEGLFRVNGDEVSRYKDGRGIDAPVTALFEDREGNLWVGRSGDIERLRDSAFVSYSVGEKQSAGAGPIYVDQEGRTWFAPFEGGLHWLKDGKTESVSNEGLSKDVVYSLAGRKGDLWIGRQRGGLTHLLYNHGSLSTKTYTKADGLAQDSVYAVHENQDGTIWSGTLSGGVSELRDGHFTTYTVANGLASDTVSSIEEGGEGTMWFGTPKGLSAKTAAGWKTYTDHDGLPSSDVNCLLRDSNDVLWIGTAAGLAFLAGDQIKVPRGVPESLQEPVFGMAEDRNGWLWITTASHVLRVKRSSLIQATLNKTDVRGYGLEDGLLGTEGVKRSRSIATDPQGNIWLSTNRGISVANPARASVDSAPALVHIEAIFADGNPIDTGGNIRFPPNTQRATFRYVGLSLANSERVRYRYWLEGFDHGWSEPTTNREATYGNLGAHPYRFHVMASNSDGLWNGSDMTVGFEIEPTIWERWWFRLSCVLCSGLAALLVYSLRMRQLARLFNVRYEERLAERTRIAQDLHDTLLQGLLSVSMQLHVAMDQLPQESPARTTMSRIMQLMGPLIEEGRGAVRGLRSSIDNPRDLSTSLSLIPQQLGIQDGVDFHVAVDGRSIPLRSVIRDDVYSIGREALVNAFRHAQARKIEVLLDYSADHLRMVIRDDGRGIDPKVVGAGRDGHWGLVGMRERAGRIGAKFKVMSRHDAGTEVELNIPGNIAFEENPRAPRKWLNGVSRFLRNRES